MNSVLRSPLTTPFCWPNSNGKHLFNLSYRNLWNTDFFWYLFQEYYEYDSKRSRLAYIQNFSNGTFGDWEITYNLFADSNFILRAGLNPADYKVLPDYYGLRGYYLGAGPIVDVDYLLKQRFLFSFNLGYWKGPWVPPDLIVSFAEYGYEEKPESRLGRPHVWKVHFDITHKSGAFAGFTYYYLVPPGKTKATRKHLQAGYRFWF